MNGSTFSDSLHTKGVLLSAPRLALLGDSVIDLIVLETLVDNLPLSRRGDLDVSCILNCVDEVGS